MSGQSGVGKQISPSSFEDEDVTKWEETQIRSLRLSDEGLHAKVQTANRWVFTSRTQSQSAWMAQLSGVITSFRCPCSPWPSARSHPQYTECTHWRSILQQVSVQIHEGLINVACYGTRRSPVWAQQHRHRLLPVAEGNTGALQMESRKDWEQENTYISLLTVVSASCS